ncbi:extracellular solute-binding protein [Staphylococcus pettenkoferi]|uniref:extracellular solute-binding protein n=1 Tax=Staphylococcus pettenkoferi TaxID=170573 RepID=UPI0030C05078
MKRILLPIILVAVLVLTAACGNGGDKSGSKDGKNGKLVIYNGQHKSATSALIKAFEKDTGIKVEERDGKSNELAHQIVEEGKNSPADLIYTEESSPQIMLDNKGLLAKIDKDVSKPIDSKYKSKDDTWTGLLARSRVVAYNKDKISESELPKSVKDLTDSKWKDKFAFQPTSGAFQAQLSAMIKLEGKDAAKEWLEGIKKNGKTYKDNKRALQAVENGDIPFALINNYYWDRQAAEKGKDNLNSRLYFFGNHDLGDMLTVASVGVVKSSKHKEEPEKFVKFSTSKKGQQILTDKSKQYPLNKEANTKGMKPFSELKPPEGTQDLGKYADGKEAVNLLKEEGLL